MGGEIDRSKVEREEAAVFARASPDWCGKIAREVVLIFRESRRSIGVPALIEHTCAERASGRRQGDGVSARRRARRCGDAQSTSSNAEHPQAGPDDAHQTRQNGAVHKSSFSLKLTSSATSDSRMQT